MQRQSGLMFIISRSANVAGKYVSAGSAGVAQAKER